MVRSKLAAAILSASFALPGLASALGVGDFTPKSYLNQPLEMEIDLVQTKDLSIDEVLASLASPEDFSRAGIDRLFFLTDLRFEVRQRANGGLYVLVRSSKPVTEPYLNFLVEVQWPQGRLLRDYVILLDPPVYKAAGANITATTAPAAAPQPSAEPAPVVVTAAPAPAPQPAYTAPADSSGLPPPPSAARGAVPRPQPAPAPVPQPVDSGVAAGEYKVQSSDTMWEIAARNRAGSASVQQTMMAIQRANPDAFINGNINLVKKGAVLRLPGEAEAQEISSNDANSQLASQTRAWREMLDQRPASDLPTDAAQLQAGGDAKPARSATKGTGTGEVTLVAPSASKGTKASGGKETAALQNQLAIAEEGLDKAARENKELSSRLGDLDKQLKDSDKLLTMKNDEIAGLQKELERLRKDKGKAPAEVPAAPAVEEPAVAAEVPAEAAPGEAPAETVAAETEKPAAKPAPKPEVAEKPKKPKREEGSSLVGPAIGLLALLGIGGAGFWFWRRRQNTAAPATAVEDLEVSSDETEAQVAEDLAQLQDLNLGGDDQAVAPAGDSESTDPLGEADMYMAYGRFQQAADILYAALQREPERGDLRVKLAEVYAEMGDNDAAREQATQAARGARGELKDQANAILARVGGGSAASAPAPAAEPSLDDLALEFSGGQDGGNDFEPPAMKDESLEFSLDDSLATGTSQAAVSLQQQPEEEFSLEDADLGDFSLADAPAAVQTAKVPAQELSLEDELSLDADLSLDSAPAPAEELSLEDDLDFAAEATPEPVAELALDEVLENQPASPADAVTAVQPRVTDVDLESELADLQADLSGEGVGAGGDTSGDDFDFLADSDENATKLDLAKAYIDMGDSEGARDILNEVVADGNANQKAEAQKLLAQVG